MALHKDLKVWRQAMDLVKFVYQITASFPSEELYGLVSQMRRSSVSIPCNIAEGATRKSDKEFIQFLHIALGSIEELETQYILSKELKLTKGSDQMEFCLEDVRKMSSGLIKHLKTKRQTSHNRSIKSDHCSQVTDHSQEVT